MLQKVSGGRPFGGLQFEASQGHVPQTWRHVRWDTGGCGGTGNLRQERDQSYFQKTIIDLTKSLRPNSSVTDTEIIHYRWAIES